MITKHVRSIDSGGSLQEPFGKSMMHKLAALTLSLTLMTGPALAETSKDGDATPAKPVAAKSNADVVEEVEELRQELQTLKEALARRDQQIDEAQKIAAEANARAAAAVAKSAEVNESPAPPNPKPTTMAMNNMPEPSSPAPAPAAIADQGQKKDSEDGPVAIRFRGVSITPAGFLAGETVNRTHATGGDIPTAFTGIPFDGNSLADVSEFNFSARQSRLSALFEYKLGGTKLNGYVEGDFLGAGTTSNNRQTNSYVYRQRQLYAMATFANGWSVTGGQQWTLATENKKGITNRVGDSIGESLPNMIDPNYVVGLTWARSDAFRVARNFDKAAFAFSIEGPQTTIGGRGFTTSTNTSATGAVTTAQNFWLDAPGTAAGLFNAFDATGYTPNKLPDFMVKAAFDPGFGHYEILGIISTFRNRIYPCAVVSPTASNAGGTVILVGNPINPPECLSSAGAVLTSPSALGAYNDSRTGGGVGASMALPLAHKKFEVGLKAVYGDGVGRFGASQLSDVTARPDGSLALIRNEQTLLKFDIHPSPKWDLYAYFGNEYAARTQYTGYSSVKVTNTAAIPAFGTQPSYPSIATYTTSTSGIGGYGNFLANNSGCATEEPPSGTSTPGTGGTCAGDIRNIFEGTIGFWHRLFQGSPDHMGWAGRIQWGLQYSYLEKFAWSGAGDVAAGAPGIAPKGIDNIFFTSIRYYLPYAK
jgi:hypothetical protein